MHLKVGHLHHRHAREGVHRSAIAPQKQGRRLTAGGTFAPGFPPGQDDTGGQTLHVPLKRSPDGFVEVVDVEDQPPIGRGEGAQVANMGITAQLGKNAGMGQHCQVGSHDRHRAAKKTKRRSRHPLPLDRQQRRHPPHGGDRQGVNGIGLPVGGPPSVLLLPPHLLAPRLSKGATFRGRQHVLSGHAVIQYLAWSATVLHLHVNRVCPPEANHILIPGDQLHVRRPGLDIVFLMDGAFLLKTGADGVGELRRHPARIVDVAILP